MTPSGCLAAARAHNAQPPQDASRPPWPKVQTYVQVQQPPRESNAPDRTSGQMRAAEGVNRKEW